MTDTPYNGIPLLAVPDLGGLPASDAGGRPIGSVFGALAEADTGLIRYLDLSLNTERRHVLVPIGHVRVRERGTEVDVRLRAAVLADLAEIPTYAPDSSPLDDDAERELIASYGRAFYGDRYYAHPAYDHSGLYIGEHPIIRAEGLGRMPAAARAAERLALLSRRSEYRVAEGQPDIRGWALMTDADLPSGAVSDLVIDLDEEQVRYIVATVSDEPGEILLPVGFLRLEPRSQAVRAPGLRHDDLASLPRFTGDEIARDLEDIVRETLHVRLLDDRRYALPDFLTQRRRAE
jgi:photosynthetic reaction center H subunit